MKQVIDFIQPERETLVREIALQKNLVTFHRELMEMHKQKLESKERRLKDLDVALDVLQDNFSFKVFED